MSFDIAIVGGGIVGAATFYKLQKRNYFQIIKLDIIPG
jgi:glycine/D-amino acid oxidase-like deaminating enzyme